jgi:hypothetical protein
MCEPQLCTESRGYRSIATWWGGQPQDSAKYVAYTYLGGGTITQAARPGVSGGLTLEN